VSEFFSLVAAGGELATAAGVTGWADGEATEAATTCFNDWLSSRGTAGDIEHDRMLALLPDFIQVNGDSRFAWAHRAMDDHAPKTINQAGFKRMVSKAGTLLGIIQTGTRNTATRCIQKKPKAQALNTSCCPKCLKRKSVKVLMPDW
jgi:putative DNA primase/helicase